MKIDLLAFGIAKDILQSRSLVFDLKEGNTIAALRSAIIFSYPEFIRLSSISFAVNEEYVQEGHVLREGDEVVLLPPVSGG